MLPKKTKKKNTQEIQVPENEEEHDIVGPTLELDAYVNPLRVHKVNIGMKEKPKFLNIGDYWNNETMKKIVDLLREY